MAKRPQELEAFRPGADGAWTKAKAAHLLRRAGFGGNQALLEQAVQDGPTQALAKLLHFDSADDQAHRRDLHFILDAAEIGDLAGWWLYRMQHGKSPLQEKMALFWHNSFATSFDKVQNVRAMAAQLLLFLDHAGGSFANLLAAIVKDPAMLMWLDATENDKIHPNENLARELFELFTLGIGHYSETDIKESARALTGHRLRNGQHEFDARRHDDSPKTVLGKTGNFRQEDVLELCLAHPATGQRLARRWLQAFVHPAPPESIVVYLGNLLRQNHYEMRLLMELVFQSRWFYSDEVRRSLIKSPVELGVGLLQALGAQCNLVRYQEILGRMGQSLLRPPSVRGWVGHRAWLDAATILERHNLALRFFSNELGKNPVDLEGLELPALSAAAPELVDSMLELLLLPDLALPVQKTLQHWAQASSLPPGARAKALFQGIVALPEYQLA